MVTRQISQCFIHSLDETLIYNLFHIKYFEKSFKQIMGCDGGTIPRRDELVRVQKKPEQKDKECDLAYRWRHCALTQQRLQEPIVMCGLGRLYSKQNIIEHLLDKEKMPDSAKHIRNLKDVKNLQLTPNPIYKDCDKTEGMLDVRSAPYICKLIGLEMTGKFRFVGLWTCGCVFSERALKEIKSQNCSLCQIPFTEEDIVILNGNEEEIVLMMQKMAIRTARLKTTKKDKKSKNHTKPFPFHSKRLATNDALLDPAMKKLKDDKVSVAENKSEVYKSLFTSHKSEQQQSRAHWVTYNPFYN